MGSPGYEWTCKKCARGNAGDRSTCESCGLSAYASANEIEPPAPPDPGVHFAKKTNWWSHAFFESLIAALTVLTAPLWSFNLIVKGKILEAAALLCATIGFSFAAYLGIRKNKAIVTWLAVVAIVSVALLALVANGEITF